jgi:hypothetical protein
MHLMTKAENLPWIGASLDRSLCYSDVIIPLATGEDFATGERE